MFQMLGKSVLCRPPLSIGNLPSCVRLSRFSPCGEAEPVHVQICLRKAGLWFSGKGYSFQFNLTKLHFICTAPFAFWLNESMKIVPKI